jgi:hypothetical protein
VLPQYKVISSKKIILAHFSLEVSWWFTCLFQKHTSSVLRVDAWQIQALRTVLAVLEVWRCRQRHGSTWNGLRLSTMRIFQRLLLPNGLLDWNLMNLSNLSNFRDIYVGGFPESRKQS